jgi:hypothetical protein
MNDTTHCLTENRRRLVRRKPLNGLDYVDIGDHGGLFGGCAQTQTYLTVFFLARLHTAGPGGAEELRLGPANFRITGGRRITDIRVLDAMVIRPKAKDEDDMVVLKLDKAGDFSCYTLEIVDAPGSRPAREGSADKHRPCHAHDQPLDKVLHHFDQRYRRVSFSFKANCPATVDCMQEENCPAPQVPAPGINYLAKDYASFRELILDRLALTMPQWRERHVPDVGIAVAEVMAYAADHLSYYQDATAQEAYLDTARRRISVRRHVRLVDYFLHEGCNARAWVCCDPDATATLQPGDFALLTRTDDDGVKPLVFEPVKRRRSALLEIGDFFDLRRFAWSLLHGEPADVVKRLPAGLLGDLKAWMQSAEAPIQPPLAARLLDALNERVLSDATFAAEGALAGDMDAIRRLNRTAFDELCKEHCVRFHGIWLTPAHAKIYIYTWRDTDCCLEAGATECVLIDTWSDAPAPQEQKPAYGSQSATQQGDCHPHEEPPKPPRGRQLRLRVGDVIIFEEVIGPQTGNPCDADASRRHAVRLTAVEPEVDTLTDTPVLRVRWSAEDALPVSFCLSKMGPPPKCEWLDHITVVRGNVVLADHGETLPEEELGKVGREDLDYHCRCVGVVDEISVRPRPFRPDLDAPELTFAVPLASLPSAAASVAQKPWQAVPALAVSSLPPLPDGSDAVLTWPEFELLSNGNPDGLPTDAVRLRALVNLLPSAAQQQWREMDTKQKAGQPPDAQCPAGLRLDALEWNAVLDLLKSEAEDRHFVVEMDDNRRGQLRFGHDGLGRTPEAGESFRACYRIGNGPAGNVGRETIHTLRPAHGSNLGSFTVRNPLAASGGTIPETLDEARRDAPHVFRLRQLRAITADDYARLAEKNPRVQRAGAEIRWTGSRQSVRVALDPLGTTTAPADLTAEVRDALLEFRRIGHDLEVIPAHYLAVDLTLDICVHSHALRGDVEVAVRDALTAGLRRDGTPGFFHPDRLTFGEPVRISRIIGAVQALPGVMSVRVSDLHRWGGHRCHELAQGFLAVSPLEVARLDQDPDFPENGTLTLNLGGGR